MKISANNVIGVFQDETDQVHSFIKAEGIHEKAPVRRSTPLMHKHCFRWKQVRVKAIKGPDVAISLADSIDVRCRGTLLSRILTMPVKNAISFDDAIRMAAAKRNEAFLAGSFGGKPGQFGWYADHFVEWISSLGYHIEITGDEFESYFVSEFVS